jgi:flagella basal body P-ring formation protein FlgA
MTSFRIFDAALRCAVLLIAVLTFVFLMAIAADAALAASLKTDVTLTGDNLTVGDIFDNSGKNAAYVLGPAPQPGKEMVLNASTLTRIASALELQWQPAGPADQIVIRRAATLIPKTQIMDAIQGELRPKIVDEKFTLDTGSVNLDVTLPYDQPPTIDVSNVVYNQRTNRFEATITAPSAANPLKKFTVVGTVRPMISIPVLKSTLRNGDIIGSADIDMIDVYTNDIQSDTLLKEDQVIGMTPRRMSIAGKPIHVVDLQSPQLVNRGDNVTIVFKSGPLNLTTMGKALQNGSRGEQIHVVNNSSNRAVDAIVSGDHEVIVKE